MAQSKPLLTSPRLLYWQCYARLNLWWLDFTKHHSFLVMSGVVLLLLVVLAIGLGGVFTSSKKAQAEAQKRFALKHLQLRQSYHYLVPLWLGDLGIAAVYDYSGQDRYQRRVDVTVQTYWFDLGHRVRYWGPTAQTKHYQTKRAAIPPAPANRRP